MRGPGPEAFLKECNQQRRAEAFYSKFKRRFGPGKSCIGRMRRRESCVKTLILNISIAAGDQVAEEPRVAGQLCVAT